MTPVEVRRISSPIILGFPHVGTYVPADTWDRLNDEGKKLRDTDWHVDELYADLLPGATMVRATFHRYVIDANRDPSGQSLYPGQNTTGLVPLTDFDNRPIWKAGEEPTNADIAARLEAFHKPYHDALAEEISRVKAEHGVAVVYDCHSIRSHCPFLFEGKLPDFNIGTNNGETCAPQIEGATQKVCEGARGYSYVANGRFKGGWTTRHYGRPQDNVHAIQMELAQSTHLTSEEFPFAYDKVKPLRLRVHLAAVLAEIESVALRLVA